MVTGITLTELKKALEAEGIGEDEELEFFQHSPHYKDDGAIAICTIKGLNTTTVFVQRKRERPQTTFLPGTYPAG